MEVDSEAASGADVLRNLFGSVPVSVGALRFEPTCDLRRPTPSATVRPTPSDTVRRHLLPSVRHRPTPSVCSSRAMQRALTCGVVLSPVQSDSDDDDEGDVGEAGRREANNIRLLAAAKRARDRRNAERADPVAPVVTVYLKELFSSPRHVAVPAALRGELLQTVLVHYIAYVQEWADGGRVPLPPFVRLGKAKALPSVTAGSQRPTASETAQQPSQRHEGDTPAVRLQPARVEGASGTKAEPLARYKLYMEAVAHLDALLEQYDHDGKQACRSSPHPPCRCDPRRRETRGGVRLWAA